ncbi:DUF1003 domain-containing protein [Sphingobacterium sp. SG20118]|uniref:DUF1003 domain-containing protein n=1 Tax=Sphingobacterium TaxID=28453 RepID=UPI0004F7B2E5|nr:MULTISPECIES: DUF1003 domain-containing protein [Sphingobacterium]AIM35926.1 hypothetical protein KO02_03915 [Sphingobacterium sp. ML3W]MDH5827945.1 DUF1003 domain-containing protein [Sphingobacterium faecium]
MKTFVSNISGKTFPVTSKVRGATLRTSIFDLVKEDFPEFSKDSLIASSELDGYKEKYISTILKNELGELNRLDELVLQSLSNNQVITASIDQEIKAETFGGKVADKVAAFGGSWTFILSFLGFLVCWIILNIYWLSDKGFDPYPFILLNLLLSCIAALQAPVIMMSQNRQEEKDRQRAQNDYMVNLKAELEIRTLHEKIDHLLIHKEQELIEMQQYQLEIIKDLIEKIDKLEKK